MGKSYKKIYGLMVLSTIFWAGAFIAGKVGIEEIPPFSIAFFRFLLAAIILFVVMIKYEKKDWKLKKKDWWVVILLGIIGMFGYHVLFFKALKYTTAINSSMIVATNPLITSILAAIFIHEKLGWKRFCAILIAFVGIALTISNGDIEVFKKLSFNHGDLLMVIAVICWATYSVISKWAMDRYSPMILTFYSFLVCVIVLIPFVIRENPIEYFKNITYKGWSAVVYMAIFPSVIGYLVQQMAIKEIGVSKSAAFLNLVPVFSIILAGLILHERITYFKLLSAFIIIIGVYLNTRIKSLEDARIVKNKE